jgi:hypothetical protein
MLRAGLSEAFVREWIEQGGVAPARPSAEQSIALKEAGASEEFLLGLLELAAPGEAAGRAGDPGPGSAPSPAAAAERPDPGGVLVEFALSYAPRFEEGDATWDLYVYLDGRPLSYVPSSAVVAVVGEGRPIEFRQRIPAGEHTLRVAQERHGRRGHGPWRHQARVAPTAFHFELAPAPGAGVEVLFRQGWESLFSGHGPLTFRARQEERAFSLEETGGDPAAWPELCEELETELEAVKEKKRLQRLEGCISWSELWPGRTVPGRAEVRDAMATFDFRPVPLGS